MDPNLIGCLVSLALSTIMIIGFAIAFIRQDRRQALELKAFRKEQEDFTKWYINRSKEK
jgi:hypothetical protein